MQPVETMLIGITGGIGAGKSVVARILRSQGFPVYDCDAEAKKLMNTDIALKDALRKLLGDAVYSSDGLLDKAVMADIIFNDEGKRLKVNELVHKAVTQDFLGWCSAQDRSPVFVESAILSTSGLEKFCDRIWLIEAPEDVRIRRVMKRNSMTKEQVRQRIHAQQKEFSYMPKDKIVVIQNSDDSPLLKTINDLLNIYLKEQ